MKALNRDTSIKLFETKKQGLVRFRPQLKEFRTTYCTVTIYFFNDI